MPELTAVEVLRRLDAPADPRPEFADLLLASLLDELGVASTPEPEATLEPGTTTSAPPASARSRRPWLRVSLAAAAAFAIAVVIVVQPPSGRQDAVAVMGEARASFSNLPSFHATTFKRVPGAWLQEGAPELERPVPDQVYEREISYLDATHFRHDVTSVTWGAVGSRWLLAQSDVQEGEYWAADGGYFASYVPSANSLSVEPIRDPDDLRFFAAGELDPEVEYMADPGDGYFREYCEVLPDDSMLGRTVRRIHCRDPRMRQYEGGPVLDVDISIDAATGMLLKLESRNEGLWFEVTSLDLVPTFAEDEFRIVAPAGAAIDWIGGGAPPPRFAPEVDAAVTASIPIGNAPTLVAADDGFVWAGAYEGGDGDWPVGGIGTVVRIDPSTDEVVARIPIPTELAEVPKGWSSPLVFVQGLTADDGQVFVSYQDAGDHAPMHIATIDPATNALDAPIVSGDIGSGVAPVDGSLWICELSGGSRIPGSDGGGGFPTRNTAVVRLDPATGEELQRIPLDGRAGSLVSGDGYLWALGMTVDPAKPLKPFSSVVFRIDPASGEVKTYPVPDETTVMAYGEGGVWIRLEVYREDGTLARVDPETGRITDRVPVGADTGDVAVGDGWVWVANAMDNSVMRIDPVTLEVREEVRVGSFPISLDVGDGSVWVANLRDTTLARIAIDATT